MLTEQICGIILSVMAVLIYIRILKYGNSRKLIRAGAFLGLAGAISAALLISTKIIKGNVLSIIPPALLAAAGGFPLYFIRSFSDNSARQKIARIEKKLLEERETRRTYEEKYRRLFEGSENSILLMDTSLQIKEANITIKRHLGRTHASVVNNNFRDLVDFPAMGRENGRLGSIVLEEKLSRFLTDRSPLVLTIPLKNNPEEEPRNFRITLEHLKQSGKNEILGTLTPINTDKLTGYLIREEQEHEIDNQIITVDEICKRLTRNLIRYTSIAIRNQILLGFREIVLNAMEHGNLEIDFKQKTEALESRSYMTLLNTRLKDPEFRDRKIKIKYSLTAEMVEYTIQDQGNGFDYKFYEEQKHNKEGSLSLHGRGIMMTKNIFDRVEYSENGSKVTLRKKL